MLLRLQPACLMLPSMPMVSVSSNSHYAVFQHMSRIVSEFAVESVEAVFRLCFKRLLLEHMCFSCLDFESLALLSPHARFLVISLFLLNS